ncbi:MAG: D-alanine--D-alanine ligase [Cyanobacteria bacterium P01_F01_bin.42]
MTLHVLHLVGSAVDEFHCKLSCLYAQSCLQGTQNDERYRFTIAYITPDRCWRFPKSLDSTDIAAAPAHSLSAALQILIDQNIDVAVPQMFCVPGMTEYRSLLTLLQIPFVGNLAEVMALTADKAKTRSVVAAAGVPIPAGELLRSGDSPNLQPPVIVKPVNTDNSMGVSLVKTAEDYRLALETAFKFSSEVLVEQYIEPGREVRCGVVEADNDPNGELQVLPLKEYLLDPQSRPIRTFDDKLQPGDSGELVIVAREGIESDVVAADDPTIPAIAAAAKQAHRALGCRHYSLFDFRIDPIGKPWFIEAGLYCSFSPNAVIPSMMKHAGVPLEEFFANMIGRVLA